VRIEERDEHASRVDARSTIAARRRELRVSIVARRRLVRRGR
jgi:hypothetical protein